MKSGHVDFGKQGEEQAREFLVKKGYKILDANFSTKIGELDLIASKDGLLVIVEVKRRKNARHGYPREAVHLHKQRQIIRLTQWYIQKHQLHHMQVRFDVIEILDDVMHHIENAFYAG
ncbi:MAG: YraN family protein [Tissierellia bacterium]|jgi:putative endonuclease|nr:YraN family protein [Bacillota bacterium]NLK58028.1 YraN family protein [Tissierellia bacterium]